jgi:hypothetical protein
VRRTTKSGTFAPGKRSNNEIGKIGNQFSEKVPQENDGLARPDSSAAFD